MQIHGACHCGAVSFTADIETLAVSGQTKGYVKVAESGNRRAQVLCPECGTPLYATAPEHATTVSIRVGCVKERTRLRPAAQIWARSAMPWLHELADVPASAEQQALLPPSPPQPAVQRAS